MIYHDGLQHGLKIYRSTMVLKNPLSTFGISAELVTRNARPGKCLLTLFTTEGQHWVHVRGTNGVLTKPLPSPRRCISMLF